MKVLRKVGEGLDFSETQKRAWRGRLAVTPFSEGLVFRLFLEHIEFGMKWYNFGRRTFISQILVVLCIGLSVS